MFKKRIKHTQRYQEIVNVFIKNGFRHFLYRIGLSDQKKSMQQEGLKDTTNMTLKSIGQKLRYSLQELGPSFIKLGQIASTRRDVLPEEIVHELQKLQEDAAPFPFSSVEHIVEEELGDHPNNLFLEFSKTPLATASIGQVHKAILKTGEDVAIKIQRPHIQKNMETDLEILLDIAKKIEKRLEWARTYRLKEMIEDLSHALRKELDYRIEAYHAEKIAKQFMQQPEVHIPKIYRNYSSEKVLTMECIDGVKVSQIAEIESQGLNRKIIAERLADSMLQQIINHGFFHGDPHAGNIYILPNNVITYLDFGMTGYINEELKFHFASLVVHIEKRDTEGIIRTFTNWDLLNEATDTNALAMDLDYLLATYYDLELKEIKIGKMIAELLAVAYRHKIDIPSNLAILTKVIITLEAIIAELDPKFSLMKAIQPYGNKLIKEQFHPKKIAKDNAEDLLQHLKLLKELPYTLKEAAHTLQKGKLRFDINIHDLQTFLNRMDKISNRISFSIILLAFSILMVGLIIGASIVGQTTLLWDLPIIEIGAIVAMIMFVVMLYTIIKSGKMK